MGDISKHRFYSLAAICLMAAASGCGKDDAAVPEMPEGMVQVDFVSGGTYGAPLSDLGKDGKAGIPPDPDPANPLNQYSPQKIEDGTTLWIAVYEVIGEENTEGPELRLLKHKSYRVSGSLLIPCRVNPDGSIAHQYDTPLFLPKGRYVFRALGPARELVEDGHGHLALYIDNGEWVIANDERYGQTAGNEIVEVETAESVVVKLKPLINQTARLKFTVYSDEEDPFVHSVTLQPIGIEVAGLQDRYSRNAQDGSGNAVGKPWNWTFYHKADTLIAYPGMKNTIMYLKKASVSTDDRLVVETPILPTDAYSSPMVVLLNVNVNGNPTQYEMVLNRKVFRSGYSYHYRGKIKIEDNVSVLEWESVSWSADIPFFD